MIRYLLILFLPGFLFASGDLFAIYVTNDVEYMQYILEGIQKITTGGNPLAHYYNALLAVAVLVGLLVTVMRAVSSSSMVELLKGAIYMLLVVLLFKITVTVKVEDVRQMTKLEPGAKQYTQVDGIPLLLGAMYGTASILEYLGTVIADESLKTLSGEEKEYSFSNVGFAKAINTLMVMMDKASRPAFAEYDPVASQYARYFKAYLNDCIIPAIPRYPFIPNIMKNPKDDIIDALSPSNIGITGSSYKITYDNTEYTCEDFYNNYIYNKYDTEFAIPLFTAMQKLIDSNSTLLYKSVEKLGYITLNPSAIGGELGALKGLVTNAALIGLTSSSLSQLNNGLNTGIDIANAITQAQTLVNLQTSGIGQFKWIALVIPKVFEIFKGAAYYYGLFIFLVMLVVGYSGWRLAFKYFLGLIGIALMGFGFAVVNDLFSYFTEKHALEILTIFGGNPATIASLPEYYMDMATYAGIMGATALTVAIAAPSMILYGQFGALTSVLGSIAGMYKQLSPDQVLDTLARQQARQESYSHRLDLEAEEMAKQKLEGLGLLQFKPDNMGYVDYYNKFYGHSTKANEDLSAYLNRDLINSASKAAGVTMANQMAQAASTYTHLGGATAAYTTSRAAGVTGGAIDAAKIQASADSIGFAEEIARGTYNQTLNQFGKTAAFGENLTAAEAFGGGAFQGIKDAAYTKKVSHMGAGEARTAGNISADKLKQQIQGFQNANVYNQDGSEGAAHGKFMEGGTQSINRDLHQREFAIADALANKSISERQRMMEFFEVSAAGKFLDDAAKARGSTRGLDIQRGKSGIEGVDYSKISWSGSSIDRGQAYENIARRDIERDLGEAMGILQNRSNNLDMYLQNAQYSEMQQQQTTDAKIKTQGGIYGAVSVDVTEAALKAAMQLGATKGNLQEFLEKSGLESKNAAALADAIVRGRSGGGKQFKKALQAATELARAQNAGKTAAQLEEVETFGGTEGYIQAQRFERGVDAASLKYKMQLFDNPKANQKLLDAIVDNARIFTGSEKQRQLIEAGLAKVNEDGELVPAVSGKEFAKRLAKFQVGKEKLTIGQERYEIDRDPEGETLTNASTLERRERGDDYTVKFKGFGGDVLGTMAEAALAGIAIDKGVKQVTGKGVFDRVREKVDKLGGLPGFSEDSIHENVIQSSNSPSQSHQSNTGNDVKNYASENLHNNSLSHPSPNIPNTHPNVNSRSIPSGWVQRESGLIVPERFATTPPHSRGGLVSSFIKGAATFLGLSTLAEASETISNIINALDPTSYIIGQPLGAGSDQVPMASVYNQTTGMSLAAAKALATQTLSHNSALSDIDPQAFAKELHEKIDQAQEANLEEFRRSNNQWARFVRTLDGESMITLESGKVHFRTKDNEIRTMVSAEEMRRYWNRPEAQKQLAEIFGSISLNEADRKEFERISDLRTLLEKLEDLRVK